MNILKESALAQTLKFVPREYPSTIDYSITSESTNVTVTGSGISATVVGGYLQITEIFTLKEGNFYNFDITNGNLIYRGRIYCTNQNVGNFTMDSGQYTEDATRDNEYAIYGQ